MSTSLHRFTPPTCTLEIKEIKFPLSLWVKSTKLQKWQFQLDFDDPRLPTAKQVKITGDRHNLTQLQSAINHYIQEFLQTSFKSNLDIEINNQPNHKQPYLQPQGLVNHQLFFGNLTHNHTADSIQLSTIQLFDLVTALEAYQTQITTSPELNSTQSKKHISLWGGIAALVIAAIGIAAISLRSPTPSNVASNSKSQSQSSEEIPPLDDVVPPQVPKTTTKSTPKPKLSDSLASNNRLPPPPAVDTPKPKPDIPDPADYPLAEVARQSGLDNTAKNPSNSEQQTESVITIPTDNPNQETSSDSQSNTEINSNSNQDLAKLNNSPTIAKVNQSDQLQEVRAYFQAKWQPPAELKQSLEYRLDINPNGSIKRVIPLGKASELYLNKTNIPLQGEVFISPLRKSQQATIRLLLNPDGGVQTFTE
ncbi:MAG: DUF4335 domain-containing protein [Waterburya sp.]